MKCPLCPIEPSAEHQFVTHSKAPKSNGGHDLTQGQATLIFYGLRLTPVEEKRLAKEYPHSDLARQLYKDQGREMSQEIKITKRDNGDSFVQDLFALLVDYKGYPKFQFERRVDAILSLFLQEIFLHTLGWNVEIVAPEFPLKHGANFNPSNIDYALFRKETQKDIAAWVLLELKTDSNSVGQEQMQLYIEDKDKGMEIIYNDVYQIAKRSTQPAKYNYLLAKMKEYSCAHPIEIVYLVPDDAMGKICNDEITKIPFSRLRNMKSRMYEHEWELFREIVLPKLIG